MTLAQIIARLAAIDVEIRAAQTQEQLDTLGTEKTELLTRKAELEGFEQRRQTALNIAAGTTTGSVIDSRGIPTTRTYGPDTPEYREVFLKRLMGKPLTEIEQREFTVVPDTAASLVPTQLANKIFSTMTKIAPMLNEITLLRVPGNLRFAVAGTNTAAAAHAEGVAVVPDADTMVNVTLGGFEFIKVVRISATVRAMGINEFESWIADNIGKQIAAVIDNEIINTATTTGGVIDGPWVDGTNQITYVPGVGLSYQNVMSLIALLPAQFDASAKFLMNKATFWNQFEAMTDANGNPIIKDDLSVPGKYLVKGYPVLIDDNVAANEAYLGDFTQIVGNLSQDIVVDRSTESGFLNNAVDFRGTAIFDCDVALPAAIVKLNV